jgi:hypothetical protein
VITLDDVLADPPLVHYDELNDELRTFGLGDEPLRWLAANVRAGQRTLETGSGMSTIVFALSGAEHTVVVPNQGEEDRLREYCAGKGIDMNRVTFVIEPSERVLPGMETGPLDVVLIDGSHSFPHVFIDWYYTAAALREGGFVIVDDTQVWTGGVLREFLKSEPGWDLDAFWSERTALFRKTAAADPDRLWLHQPYVAERSTPPTRAQRIVQMARSGQWKTLAEKAAANARKAVDRR